MTKAKAKTAAPLIGYPFAVTIKRGVTGMYTARSQFGRTIKGYSYDCGFADGVRQAKHHARIHADKFTKPGRLIAVAEHPNGREYVAIVSPQIDPALQLHIRAIYHYPRGQAYGLHRVIVTRLDASGHWEVLADETDNGGNGQHYETAYRALVARGIIEASEGPHGSLYWRETLEANDNGYHTVDRKKDM